MATETLAERALAAHREMEELIQADVERKRQERYEQQKTDLLDRIHNILGDVPVTFLDPIPHPDPDCEGDFPLAEVDGLLVSLFPFSGYDLDIYRPCPSCGSPQRYGQFATIEALGRLLSHRPGPCERCTGPTTEEKTAVEPAEQPRDNYLESIGVRDLRERAHELLNELGELRLQVNRLKDRLLSFQEVEELERARLMMSEAYNDKAGPGRNAETREAWLRQQRRDDPEYAGAISARELVGRELAAAEAKLEAKGREFSVVLAPTSSVSMSSKGPIGR